MPEQNFNLQETSNSCHALADSVDRFLDYLEKTFDLSTDEATWFLAGIIHRQPQSVENDPTVKEQYTSLAQHIKVCRTINQVTVNEQN